MKLNLDLSNYEESSGVQLVPAGIYPVTITSTDGKKTKSEKGEGFQLIIKMKVTSGEYKGYNLVDYITIFHPSTNDKGIRVAENIGRGTLKTICRVTDIGTKIKDSEQLHGTLLNVRMEQEASSDGKIYNRAKGYDFFDEALAKSKNDDSPNIPDNFKNEKSETKESDIPEDWGDTKPATKKDIEDVPWA